MRVLIINNEFPPIGGGSGLGSYYLAREFAHRGAQVAMLTTQAGFDSLPSLEPQVRFFRVPGWRKGLLDAGKRGMLSFLFFGGLRFLTLRLSEYDVVIYYSSIPAGLLSLLKPRHCALMTLHGLDVPGRDPGSFAFIHKLLAPFNLRTWRRAAVVTTNSENLRNSALQFTPDLLIQVISQGVDRGVFYPIESPEPEKARPFIIVGTSRLIPLKGFQYLIEAMRELPGDRFQLWLVGRGPYEPELRALSERWNLSDRVKFLGYHTQLETAHLLRQSDVFVLPSYGDSFANALLEAMACGIPVVGAAAGGTPELIRHGENGLLVPPHDSQALVEAIRLLEGDPALRRRIREAGLATIERNYSWEAYGQKYWDLCQQISARRP